MEKLKLATVCSGIGAPEKALTLLGIPYELVFFSEIDNAVRKHNSHLIQGALDVSPDGLVGTFTISADSEEAMKKTTQAIRQIPSIIRVQGV